MTEINIINELISIEAFAEELRKRAYSTRKRLESFNSLPSSTAGKKKKALSEGQIAQLLANRRKTILRNAKE
jgi:hypothetical protein